MPYQFTSDGEMLHDYGVAFLDEHICQNEEEYEPLAQVYASRRTIGRADGPDVVHKMTIARREILQHDPNFRMNSPAPMGHSEPALQALIRS